MADTTNHDTPAAWLRAAMRGILTRLVDGTQRTCGHAAPAFIVLSDPTTEVCARCLAVDEHTCQRCGYVAGDTENTGVGTLPAGAGHRIIFVLCESCTRAVAS